MHRYKVVNDISSQDNRFHLSAGEVVEGNGDFVGKVGVLKNGKWDLVEKSALQRVRTGVDRRRGPLERRQVTDRRDAAV